MALTIGCDPELVCRTNNRLAHANNYFKQNSSMGLDGCDSIAEIRPGYSESPIDLTAKIKVILDYGHDKAPRLQFYSGHYVEDYSIGGHIHLSVKPEQQIIDSLDVTLGSLSDCIDDKQQRAKRLNSGYGKKGAYRNKQYGMEYRMPGSWLLSPTIALVTLTLAKLTVLGVKEDNLNFREIKNGFNSFSFLHNIKYDLKTIPEDCYEGLIQLELLINSKPDWNRDILPAWGIEVES